MIDLHKALDIAKEYYSEKGLDDLTKVYESDKIWIVYAGKKDQPKFGNAGISIDKETGAIGRFILPSRTNFEILRNAKLIDI